MIVRCEFEKHEPVRNVTALAEMPYLEWRADPTKPDAGYESMKARGLL